MNALDAALRKALGAFYPVLDGVHLVDYKVRILDGSTAATAARTRVVIDSAMGERAWSTMGSAGNIIAASAAALVEFAGVRDLEGRRGGAAAGGSLVHDACRRAGRREHRPALSRTPTRPVRLRPCPTHL